jgi:hypothetical protein
MMTFEDYEKMTREEQLEAAVAEMLRVLVIAHGPEEVLRRLRAEAGHPEQEAS